MTTAECALPAQVGEVTVLRELAIEQNWGMVPSSLGLERLAALRQLTFLSLRNCRLASLPRGAAMLTGGVILDGSALQCLLAAVVQHVL